MAGDLAMRNARHFNDLCAICRTRMPAICAFAVADFGVTIDTQVLRRTLNPAMMTTLTHRCLLASFVVTLVLGCGGCATVVRGDKQRVKLITDPPGADLVVDGTKYVSPAEVTVKRKQPHDITISKEGYQAICFKLKSHWDAGGAGAVVLDAAVPGGSVLFVVDTLVGADRQFDTIATIKLPPAAVPPTTQPITLYEYKGQLLSKRDYDVAVEKDKLFKSKKPPTTQPAT
jgi:hypothetical protein